MFEVVETKRRCGWCWLAGVFEGEGGREVEARQEADAMMPPFVVRRPGTNRYVVFAQLELLFSRQREMEKKRERADELVQCVYFLVL